MINMTDTTKMSGGANITTIRAIALIFSIPIVENNISAKHSGTRKNTKINNLKTCDTAGSNRFEVLNKECITNYSLGFMASLVSTESWCLGNIRFMTLLNACDMYSFSLTIFYPVIVATRIAAGFGIIPDMMTGPAFLQFHRGQLVSSVVECNRPPLVPRLFYRHKHLSQCYNR
jgi:hypothetical protein